MEKDILSITPVEIAKLLDEEGILNDSVHRPGLPLRRLIRDGKIEGAWQDDSRRWHIDRVEEHVERYSIQQVAEMCGYKSPQPIYAKIKDKAIPFELTESGNIYFEKLIIEKWIKNNTQVPVSKPVLSKKEVSDRLLSIIQLSKDLKQDLDDVIHLLDSLESIMANSRSNIKIKLIRKLLHETANNYFDDLSKLTEKPL